MQVYRQDTALGPIFRVDNGMYSKLLAIGFSAREARAEFDLRGEWVESSTEEIESAKRLAKNGSNGWH